MKKFYPYTKGYRLYIILCPLAIIGEVLLHIRIPKLMSVIVDVGIANADISVVTSTGLQMMLMAAIAMIFGAISSRSSAKGAVGSAANLREALFKKVQSFSFTNVDNFSTASLVTRLTTDVSNTMNAFRMMMRMLVRAPVMMISATFMAYSINSELCKVFLVAMPVLLIVVVTIMTAVHPLFKVMLGKYDKLNASVQEDLIAVRVVKSFVRENYEKKKFKTANDELKKASVKAEKLVSVNMPAMMLTVYSCIIAVLWFGGNKIVAGTMLTGQLISFISYITQILMSLMMISMVFVQLVISRASRVRISEVLEEKITFDDSDAAAEIKLSDGSVEFRHVSFKYRDDAENNVLDDINLRIGSGQTVGIIGGTGSAKTTLVQLIPRLYEATSGEVLVGGHNVDDYTFDELRGNVSMVLQKNLLFSGTIAENLRWGNEDATDEELISACKSACAHDFIMSFPQGYNTDLGQGGVNVSGGQKQRICIARALLKDPKILILDDSTSAVDTATETIIRENWETVHADMTKIIIAQRITSVCDADMIIVIDEGKINAVGTHEELLETCEIYREVYNSQQKGVA